MNSKKNGNKLVIYYKVFNESDFMEASLKSVYDYADKIVIFEYCLESMRRVIRADRVTDRGLSVDGTTEIIRDFPDPDNKIVYCPAGFIYGAESIPYQMIVDTAEVGEYIWVVDGDIVYPKRLCKKIRRWVDGGLYDVLWVPERVFYHDLYTEKTIFFNTHQRVFRKPHEGCFYFPKCFEVQWIVHDGITDKAIRWLKRMEHTEEGEGSFIWDDRKYMTKAVDADRDGFAYHYALVRDTQRILEKLLWQYEMIDRKWKNEEEQRACRTYRDPLEFKLKTHCYFLAHEPQDRAPWTEGHPRVMKDNKWMQHRWDEKPMQITYDEARAMVGSPGECE